MTRGKGSDPHGSFPCRTFAPSTWTWVMTCCAMLQMRRPSIIQAMLRRFEFDLNCNLTLLCLTKSINQHFLRWMCTHQPNQSRPSCHSGFYGILWLKKAGNRRMIALTYRQCLMTIELLIAYHVAPRLLSNMTHETTFIKEHKLNSFITIIISINWKLNRKIN